MGRIPPRYISNESPIWYLHGLGLLRLLPRLYERILIPSQVAIDIDRGIARGVDLPDPRRLAWIGIGSPTVRSIATVREACASVRVHPGEREVVALALDYAPRSIAIIDDDYGRVCAERVGVRVMGTLRVLADARLPG